MITVLLQSFDDTENKVCILSISNPMIGNCRTTALGRSAYLIEDNAIQRTGFLEGFNASPYKDTMLCCQPTTNEQSSGRRNHTRGQ